MGLNAVGIGFNVSAKDTASPTLMSVSDNLTKMAAKATAASDALDKVGKSGSSALDAAARKAAAPAAGGGRGGTVAIPSMAAVQSASAANGGAPMTSGPTPQVKPPPSGGNGDAMKGLLDLHTMREAAAQMERLSEKLKAFGEMVSSVFEQGAEAATAFGKGISELSTLVPEAQFKVEDMKSAIMSMSSQFGGKMEDQIRAMYQGISAGAADAASSTALLTQANKLAIGGVTDVRTAVDGLTNVLNAYGQSYTKENLQGLSDAFFVGLSKGKTTAAELSKTLGMVAPSAAAVGISMSDLIASISAITTKGIDTAQAITGMKAALAVISHPAKEAGDEAKRLGIQFNEAAIRAKGFPAFLESITKNAKFNADTMTKLFGGSIEAKNAMLALAGGGDAFNDTLNAMKNRLGATDAAFAKMADSPAFQGQLFAGLKEQALIVIGQAILPIQTALYKVANAILKAFTGAPPALQKFFVGLLGVAGAVATVLGGVLGATAAITGLIIAGKALLIGLGIAAAAVVALTAVMIPLIAAVTTLYLIWTKNIGGIQTQMASWYNKVSLAFRGIAQLISTGTLSGALQEELGDKSNATIKGFVVTVYMWFGRVRNFFTSLGKTFSEGLVDLGPVIDRILQAFQSLAGSLIPVSKTGSEAKSTFEKFGQAGATVGRILVKAVGFIADGLLNLIQFARGVRDTLSGFAPLFDAIWDAVKALGGALGEMFAVLSGGDSSTASSADMWRMFGQILGTIVTTAIYSVITVIRILTGVFEFVSGVIGAVQATFQGLVNGIVLGGQLIGEILTGNWSKAWDTMLAIIDNAVNTIVQTLAKLAGGAAGVFDSLGKLMGKDFNLKASVDAFAKSADAHSNLAKAPSQAQQAAPVDTSKMMPAAAPLKQVDTYGPAVQAAPTIDKQQVGAPTLPVAQSTASANNLPGAQPSSSNAQTANALQHLVNQKPPPAEVTVKNTVVLDGAVIAENTSKQQAQQAGRAFAPLPSPT